MRAHALNCTLKPSPAASSTDVMLDLVQEALERHDVAMTRDRVVDHAVAPGVTADEGDGDDWPGIAERVFAAELLVFATPIWMGHPSSVAQRAMERLDAHISEMDDRGQQVLADRVAVVAVVGNEDGAHHVGAEVFQGLNDVGFSLPAGGMTYWVGEAMHGTDFKDLDRAPDKVASTTATMAANAVHLARSLAERPYPDLG